MAFERKRVIDRLRQLQDQINRHAVKIIAWPDNQEVPHWKRKLTRWGDDLASITMLTPSGLLCPIGFYLTWKHLYLKPFAGKKTMAFILRSLQQEGYTDPVTKTIPQIMSEYTAFVRPFCQAIGSQELVLVDDIVNALGQPTAS